MRDIPEPVDGEEIIVEVRLSDEALARRISDWLDGSAVFIRGAAHSSRGVVIADHVPDDADAPVILLSGPSDRADWPRDGRVAARLPPAVDFIKLRIAIEAAAYGVSVTAATGTSSLPALGQIVLTGREKEVLRLLTEGASNKVIARALGISSHTVKFHVASILEKLDASSRTEAVMTAVRLGIFMV